MYAKFINLQISLGLILCLADQLYIFLNLSAWKQPKHCGGVYVMLVSGNFKVALVSDL